MIDPKDVTRGMAQKQEPDCDHPKNQIIDRPDRSYCKRCQKDVPPLMRDKLTITLDQFVEEIVKPHYERLKETVDVESPDENAEAWCRPSEKISLVSDGKNWHRVEMDWMGRVRKGVFPVFPSGG